MRRASILFLAFLAACASTTGSLSGTRWTLSDANGAITLAFDETHATGSGGCNNYRAPFTLSGTGLTFGPAISTKRACIDPPANARETSYLTALRDVTSYSISGDTLALSNAAGQPLLLFDRVR